MPPEYLYWTRSQRQNTQAEEAAEEEETGEDQEEEEIPTPDSLVSIPSGGTKDLDEIPEEVSDFAHLHRFVGALALSQKKKKKDSKKEKDKAKKRKGKDKVDAEQDEIDRRIFAQLKTMGLTKLGMPERPYCTICQKFGHSDDRCWYNPNFRGRIPEHVKQKVQAPAVNEVGTGDNQPRPINFRNWNNRGPNQRFRNQGDWMNQGNQNFQAADANAPCNYCGASGHRQGLDCSLWCKHHTERVILEEMEVGTSKKWMNEAIPEQSSDSKLQAEIPQEGQTRTSNRSCRSTSSTGADVHADEEVEIRMQSSTSRQQGERVTIEHQFIDFKVDISHSKGFHAQWLQSINFLEYARENYAIIFAAEQGRNFGWANMLYDRLHSKVFCKDKRKTQRSTKVGPLITAIFSYVRNNAILRSLSEGDVQANNLQGAVANIQATVNHPAETPETRKKIREDIKEDDTQERIKGIYDDLLTAGYSHEVSMDTLNLKKFELTNLPPSGSK
ncbi:hypothetical protein L7F22_047425 [Adiantum nelumboides]|nr:hypothetical protein [Adiantum nelumboides]